MEIRVLGAHNRESRTTHPFCLLVDGRLAVDAGALGATLTLAEQEAIQSVLLTHHHLDHIKDLPTLGFNTLFGPQIEVFASTTVRDAINRTLFDPEIWLPLFDFPPDRPSLLFREARAYKPFDALNDYHVTPVPSEHKVAALGYYVECRGKSFLYTCDTGPGFVALMRDLDPDLLVTEVTLPNAQAKLAHDARHLTPDLLRGEIAALQARRRVPQILVVHVDPRAAPKIREELAVVAAETGVSIDMAQEDQRIRL